MFEVNVTRFFDEMVKTNVINAYELVRACYVFKAKKYFCVSTDKAANPEFMGASKREWKFYCFMLNKFHT